MLATLILLAVGRAAGVSWFLVGSFMHVRCQTHTYLRQLAIFSLEWLVSGICLFDIFIRF
jgi:hypothetical protein